MAPNEFQLRAALHDGEGDSPDADALISHAVGVRRERRRRITAIAGSTVVVAVVALGVAGVLNSNDSSGNGGGAAADAGGANTAKVPATMPGRYAVPSSASASSTRGAAALPSTASSAAATAIANHIGCPATPDRFALPGGGGSGQFGSTGPLFGQPVAALRMCGYPLQIAQGPRALTVSGTQAQQIAQQLDAAPASRDAGECAPNADYLGGTLEVFPVATSLKQLRPVVVTVDCVQSEATNGTALRYVSNLPLVFMKLVVPHPVSAGGTPQPIQGSPVR